MALNPIPSNRIQRNHESTTPIATFPEAFTKAKATPNMNSKKARHIRQFLIADRHEARLFKAIFAKIAFRIGALLHRNRRSASS